MTPCCETWCHQKVSNSGNEVSVELDEIVPLIWGSHDNKQIHTHRLKLVFTLLWGCCSSVTSHASWGDLRKVSAMTVTPLTCRSREHQAHPALLFLCPSFEAVGPPSDSRKGENFLLSLGAYSCFQVNKQFFSSGSGRSKIYLFLFICKVNNQNVLSILMIIVMIKSIMIVLTAGSLLNNVHTFNFLNLQYFTISLSQRKLE